MQTQYTSKVLYHFVGHSCANNDEHNFEVLKKILSTGCISHPPHDNNWGDVSHTVNWDKSLIQEELVVPTITCYADIPFESLGTHVSKYGKFGISIPKDIMIQYGARPVMYIPMRNDDWASINGCTLLTDLEAIYKGYHQLVSSKLPDNEKALDRSLGNIPDTESQAIKAMENAMVKDLLSFIKPFNSHLNENHRDNFYMEREWRKHGNMKFNPTDVDTIVVATGFMARLKQIFPQYADRVREI